MCINRLSNFPSSIQFGSKFLLLGDLQPMVETVTSFADIYRANCHPHDKYYRICCKFAGHTKTTVQTSDTTLKFFGAFVFVGGIVESMIKDERVPFAHCHFPTIDDYSNDIVYALVTLYNTAISILMYISFEPSEIFFYMIAANLMLIPEIIQREIAELSTKLLGSCVAANDIKESFVRYMQLHQQYNE